MALTCEYGICMEKAVHLLTYREKGQQYFCDYHYNLLMNQMGIHR